MQIEANHYDAARRHVAQAVSEGHSPNASLITLAIATLILTMYRTVTLPV